MNKTVYKICHIVVSAMKQEVSKDKGINSEGSAT